jgi:hypothetical protein
MTDLHVIEVCDSSEFGELADEEVAWLRRLQQQLLVEDHVIALERRATETPNRSCIPMPPAAGGPADSSARS